ncbi:uncharacterized protein LOC108741247 [Agrilus planipennis]|uniref:Uncharacterized protein LOC108741247 n=1 Tax=Agrilus planipennis TaxID=224129 RepID=A0A1W4XGK3_AGRPL|nr:uncharacterized protein LOC108741247 [Agrilus planipennis]
MWVVVFSLVLLCDSVFSLSCYRCNSTGYNGNDCIDPINKNTFRPEDCSNTAVQDSFWDRWNIFSRIIDNTTDTQGTQKKEMERFFWPNATKFDWNRWNIFSKLIDNYTDEVSDTDKEQMGKFFWPNAQNFDWNRWKTFSNLVESFNDTYATEARDMERFFWLKRGNSRRYQCVTVEKLYGNTRTVERYCNVKNKFTNHCTRLSNQAGTGSYAVTQCLLCEYDGCNSSVSYTLSFTLGFFVLFICAVVY